MTRTVAASEGVDSSIGFLLPSEEVDRGPPVSHGLYAVIPAPKGLNLTGSNKHRLPSPS